MSNNYPIDFSVTDYQGSITTLSSYNLPITPLTFAVSGVIPIIGDRTTLIWDFGDGTRQESANPDHIYSTAGLYTVKLTFYDCYNQGVISSITKDIQIVNFINDTFSVTISGTALSSYSGSLTQPLVISQTVPYNYTNNTIRYSVTDSNTVNYFYLPSDKYNHLRRYNTLLQFTYSGGYINNPFEVDTINLSLSPIYVKLSGSSIIPANIDEPTATIAGYSSLPTSFYYKDDSTNLSAYKLTFNRVVSDVSNTLNITLTGSVQTNSVLNLSGSSGAITITSNGEDGDIQTIGYFNAFNISPFKLENTSIPFVACVRGTYNCRLKSIRNVSFGLSSNNDDTLAVSIYKVNEVGDLSLMSTTDYNISSIPLPDTAGCIRCSVEFINIKEPTQVQIFVSGNKIGIVSENIQVSGYSSTFTVYPKDYYQVYKKNENFNSEEMFKSLRLQESLQDKDIFFEKFLGTIFGGHNPDLNALGKKVYERIANFVDNNTNINTLEILKLVSTSNMLDASPIIYSSSLFNVPDKIQRLLGLLSINKNTLFGVKNAFAENFDTKGHVDKDIYGINLGDEIDPYSYLIDRYSEPYLVAYEKFSSRYILLNAFQPPHFYTELLTEGNIILLTEDGNELVVEIPYIVADYDDTWGWPLVLPDDYTSSDITKYYKFYRYNNTLASNIVGSVIDFNVGTLSSNTSRYDLVMDNGIYEKIVLNTLYQSLSLTK